MAVNGRPSLPEVSSAPSWFEFSSFLLTLAAEADMVSQAENYRRLEESAVRSECWFSRERRALDTVWAQGLNNVLLLSTQCSRGARKSRRFFQYDAPRRGRRELRLSK